MFRFSVQEDDISKFIIIHDQFKLRPYDKSKSEIHTGMRVILDLKNNPEPFVQVIKVKENFKEWWINVGNKDTPDQAKLYEMVKKMFANDYAKLL